MKSILLFAVLAGVSSGVFVHASADASADASTLQETIDNLRSFFPELEVTQIRPSQIDGLYEVMDGAEVFYSSPDGRYIVDGDLIDLQQKRNLSEEQRTKARAEILAAMPPAERIDFSPKETKHDIYVFTDISCGYCRQLHRDVAELNKHGIAVHYLAFPRQGPGSANFKDMESVWCADDPNQAMTRAKFGQGVEPKQCSNPVAKHYQLGQEFGVPGTPAIYLEDGSQIGGYLPPEELIQALN